MTGGTQVPDAADLAALRARFRRMIAVLVACVVAAIVGIVSYFAAHQAWGLGMFVAALVSGFAAQVWFVAAMRR